MWKRARHDILRARDEMGWMAAMIHIAMHVEIIVEEGKYLLAVEKWSI